MNTRIKLNDKNSIPLIGFGTFEVEEEAISLALDVGYRHFDSADYYQNEHQIGKRLNAAINSGKVNREDLYIVSKVWQTWVGSGRPTTSVRRSLSALGLEYLDLVLIHWPTPFAQVDNDYWPKDSSGNILLDQTIALTDIWEELIEIREKGLCRSIGVSNFNSEQIQELIDSTGTAPAVNQVESHPFLNNTQLLEWSRQKGIVLTAYSPLATTGPNKIQSPPLEEPLIKELAAKYGVSPAAVCIRWQTQRGVVVIPKSSTKERIISNLNVFDFELTPEDIQLIEGLNKPYRCHPWNHLGIANHKYYPFKIPF